MHRRTKKRCAWLLILSALLTGCQPIQPYYLNKDGEADLSHYLDVATEIEYTDVCQKPIDEVAQAYSPRTISNPQFDEFWDLSLEDAMSHAMHNSKVIRTFGQVRQFGQILGGAPERLTAAPDSVATVYDTAIQETGQSGVEQALAAFDAVFSSNATWDNTDRAQNFNGAQVVNATQFQQDQVTINNEISKLSAGGTQWFFRNVSIYTGANNSNTAGTRAPGIPSDWFTAFEAELRHPLMRNRGAQLNRAPVILARIRTDLSLIDFQGAVRDLLNSVEQSYWELYFFYHNLRAAKIGRDSALAAHQKVRALYDEGAPGGEAEKEAQAREQYFFFRDRVEQAQRDLFRSETRLRYLMGLSPTDHRLIRPSDKPTAARVEFDWNLIREEAMLRSGELRRMGFRIRQRELELIAARNQMLPQLDVIGLWRQLGIGDRFAAGNDQDFPSIGSSAWDRLWEGHFQEFRLGFDMQVPLGLRREMAQVRSSQLALARERARLQDAELETVHQLTDAVQNLDAGFRSVQTNFSRRLAAEQQVEAVEAAYLAGTVALDLLLDAQRRQADANTTYYQSLVDYNLAITRVHYRKGSLMEFNGVQLAEGPWPEKAYFDAANEARRRDASHYLNYGFSRPNVISRGPAANRWNKGSSEIRTAAAAESYRSGPEGTSDSSLPAITNGEEMVESTVGEPVEAAESDSGESLGDALQDAIDSMSEPDSIPSRSGSDVMDLPAMEEPITPKEISPPSRPKPADPKPLNLDDLEARRKVRPVSANMPILGDPRVKTRPAGMRGSFRKANSTKATSTKANSRKVTSSRRKSKTDKSLRPKATIRVLPPQQADVVDIRWK